MKELCFDDDIANDALRFTYCHITDTYLIAYIIKARSSRMIN